VPPNDGVVMVDLGTDSRWLSSLQGEKRCRCARHRDIDQGMIAVRTDSQSFDRAEAVNFSAYVDKVWRRLRRTGFDRDRLRGNAGST